MNKALFLLFVFLFSSAHSSFAVSAENGAFRIELKEKLAVRDTEIIPFPEAGKDPRKNIKVRVHTTKEVWALEKTPDAPDVLSRGLGIWESELIVLPKKKKGHYPVDLIMSLRLPGGTVKRVERHLDLASASSIQEEVNTIDQLRNDFVDLVRNQYWPVDENLAEQFDQVLVKFASRHMKQVTADLPSALAKQDEETLRRQDILEKREEENAAAKTAEAQELERAVQGKFNGVRKENEKTEEDTNFVLVDDKGKMSPAPQFTRRIRFDLTALTQNGVERYRVAEVVYHTKTIRFSDGMFRTNFRLDVHYMLRDKYSTSKNFEHAGAYNEETFLENWKKDFWRRASSKLINGGEGVTDKAERAYVVELLEPELFQEQYAFSEFLAKAKFSFDSEKTQKELRKLRKKFEDEA